ncbi:MAG TPA: hypothetical protein VK845_00220 [Gemmatimonadales bacterium]|nr:hypothetical protein [Gemmatimonadales bacterium]
MKRLSLVIVLPAAWLAACRGDPVSPPPLELCHHARLAAGAHVLVDPLTSGGCLKLPSASAAGAEYLVVAVSTAGTETPAGISEAYTLTGQPAAGVATAGRGALPSPALRAFRPSLQADEFHLSLRKRERELARDPRAQFSRGGITAAAVVPPPLGDQRDFWVCAETTCSSFVQVTATAKYVGPRGAIYLDNTVPAGGLTQADIDSIGTLFDGGPGGGSDNMYAIDSAAFGSESDLDGNSVAIILLTDAVNALSGNCNSAGSVILGFFFGTDLFPGMANSNGGEIFYGFVPDPANPSCTVSKSFVESMLPPTFIHEFQHMISFNQRVLVRSGLSEDTWLNEALSHFAEELGGRLLPPDGALGSAPDRFSQFLSLDVPNAYDYLEDPEATFLISPGNSTGTLKERGANWLFMRWIADHFDSDPNGTNLTRSLVQTTRVGAANVAAATGVPFSTLIPEWQLANYLDNLPGFTAQSPRLQYDSWNFRSTFASLNQQAPGTFPRPYPLVPDQSANGTYTRTGTLRSGSGRHIVVTQSASADSLELRLRNGAGAPLSPTIAARYGVVRIR